MPGGDRTGPRGFGPLTGRKMGCCAGYPHAGFFSPGPGFGMGRGMGPGRGFGRGMGPGRGRGFWGPGHGYWDDPPLPFSREDEKALLENQAKEIGERLKQIQARLDELKKAPENPREK